MHISVVRSSLLCSLPGSNCKNSSVTNDPSCAKARGVEQYANSNSYIGETVDLEQCFAGFGTEVLKATCILTND